MKNPFSPNRLRLLEGFAKIAHRGGFVDRRDAVRENSMFAFMRAVEAGYDYLETDVHATADGRLVAFHDSALDRVTDRTGMIAKLPLSQIRKARIGGIDPIPTLDEVLDTFKDVRINIDIKSMGAVDLLARTLRHHCAQDRVCVASFSHRRLSRFRSVSQGQVPTSMSRREIVRAVMMPHNPRVWETPAMALQMPENITIGKTRFKVVTPALLAAAHQNHRAIHVWTVNDRPSMERLLRMGVDGIISDDLSLLNEVVAELRQA